MMLFSGKAKTKFMKKVLFYFLVLFSVYPGIAFGQEHDPAQVPGINLTQAESNWLQSHPEIRLSPDPDFLPIEFVSESGQYTGIAADYVALIEKKLGIKFKILKFKNWSEVLEKTKNKESDMWGAATPTPQRLEYMSFT